MFPKNGVGWHHLYIDRHICRYIDRYKIYSIYQISCSRPPICIQLIREMHRVIPLNCIQYHATTICNLGKKNEIQFKLNCLCCILLMLVLTFLKITCSFLSWSNATTLLFCQNNLGVELYWFQRHSNIRTIWKNWVLIPPNHRQGHTKSNSKS